MALWGKAVGERRMRRIWRRWMRCAKHVELRLSELGSGCCDEVVILGCETPGVRGDVTRGNGRHCRPAGPKERQYQVGGHLLRGLHRTNSDAQSPSTSKTVANAEVNAGWRRLTCGRLPFRASGNFQLSIWIATSIRDREPQLWPRTSSWSKRLLSSDGTLLNPLVQYTMR